MQSFFPAELRPSRVACIAAVLFVLILLPKIGSGTLWHHDELLTANRSREMIVRGNPFEVTVNFAPSFKKPPLQYWACAALLRLLPGRPELALRLPTLLAGAGCLLAAAWLMRVHYPDDGDKNLAVWAALALAGCGFLIHFSRVALLDTGAALALTLTLIGCRLARRDARWWWFTALWCAVGAWQKAPYGLAAWIVVLLAERPPLAADQGRWRGHLPLALAAATLGSFGWWIIQWMSADRALLLTAGREQIGNFLRAHDPTDEGFRPWWYWVWLARDWGLLGICAPVAALAALRDRERAGLAWTTVLFGVVLACLRYRAERYLVVVTPALAVLAVGFLQRAARGLPEAARRWIMPLALATTIPAAAYHYFKPAPFRPDLLAVAQALGHEVLPDERVFICSDADPGFATLSFVLFYAHPRRPLEEMTLPAGESLISQTDRCRGICSREQWQALSQKPLNLRENFTQGEWVLWTCAR